LPSKLNISDILVPLLKQIPSIIRRNRNAIHTVVGSGLYQMTLTPLHAVVPHSVRTQDTTTITLRNGGLSVCPRKFRDGALKLAAITFFNIHSSSQRLQV
jgi:hypothetical protein